MASIVRRLVATVAVLAGAVTLTFLLLHLVPGDPVEAMLGEGARARDRLALTVKLGLDQPLWVQYMDFWRAIVTLDFGESLYDGRSIGGLLLERLPWTLALACAAMIVALGLALPLGVIAALQAGRWPDRWATVAATLGLSVPNFWLAQVLILIFGFWLAWLPISGNAQFSSVILPALTLGTSLAAVLARMLRSSLLETLSDDYIRTARAKGLSMPAVVRGHALRNAALPVVTLVGLQTGALLGGAVITEVIFSWPGIGQLTVDAIQRRDYPLLQMCVLLITAVYVVVNRCTDAAYGWLDPRVVERR